MMRIIWWSVALVIAVPSAWMGAALAAGVPPSAPIGGGGGPAIGYLNSLYCQLSGGSGCAITGNASVGGTFGVTGATTLSSTLAVTGAITGSSYIHAGTAHPLQARGRVCLGSDGSGYGLTDNTTCTANVSAGNYLIWYYPSSATTLFNAPYGDMDLRRANATKLTLGASLATFATAVSMSSTTDMRGAVSNDGSSNGGDVYINDGMRVTGFLKPTLLAPSVTATSFSSAISNTLTPTTVDHEVSCTSGADCPVTISETGAVAGQRLTVTCMTGTLNNCVLQQTAGQVLLPGGVNLTLGQNDTATLRYSSAASAWIATATTNN